MRKSSPLTKEHRKNISLALIGRHVSEATRLKDSLRKRGSNNPMWKGGVTSLQNSVRGLTKYTEWRLSVFSRDEYTCVLCKQIGGEKNADHIKPLALILKQNMVSTLEEALSCAELWDVNNGRTLCVPCHRKTETYSRKIGNSRLYSTEERLTKVT